MNTEEKKQVPLEKWLWDLACVLRGLDPYDRSLEHRLSPVAWVAAMLCQGMAREEERSRSKMVNGSYIKNIVAPRLVDAINLHEGEEDDEWLAQPEFYDEARRALEQLVEHVDAEEPPYSLHGLLCFMRNEFKRAPGFGVAS
jgi:hypothetical protein